MSHLNRTTRPIILLLVTLMIASSIPAALAEAPTTKIFTDSTGREVEVPAAIERVALSGTLAQIVLLPLARDTFVGLPSRLSKTSARYLEDIADLPELGALYGGKGDLNLEALLAADPQIVVDVGETKEGIAAELDALQAQIHIPVVHIDADTRTIGEAYRMLGDLLGREKLAATLTYYVEFSYSYMEELASKTTDSRPSLLYLVGDDGLGAIARGSYHAEIVDLLADNAAVVENPSSRGLGNPVDMEQLLIWNPDVIIFSEPAAYENAKTDPLWQQLSAIKTGRYALSPYGPFNWMGFPPSVQRYLGLWWLGALLYPEQSGYDLYDTISDYYELFYGYSLSRNAFDDILKDSWFIAE